MLLTSGLLPATDIMSTVSLAMLQGYSIFKEARATADGTFPYWYWSWRYRCHLYIFFWFVFIGIYGWGFHRERRQNAESFGLLPKEERDRRREVRRKKLIEYNLKMEKNGFVEKWQGDAIEGSKTQ